MYKKSPLITVVMNCLNGEKYLKEALDSLCAQTLTDWELVFWDNDSRDRSREIVFDYQKKYGADKIKIFKSQTTVPLGQSRFWAFKKARGDFIAILDVDDIWLSDKLENQMRLFDNNDVGLTVTDSVFFRGTEDCYTCFSKHPPERGRVFGHLLRFNFMSTEAMIFRKSHLNRLSYWFNPSYTMVCDYDLTLRLSLVTEVDYLDIPLSKWRMHGLSETSKRPWLLLKELYELSRDLYSKSYSNDDSASRDNPYSIYRNGCKRFYNEVSLRLALEAWREGDLYSARCFFPTDSPFFVLDCLSYIYPLPLPQSFIDILKRVKRILYK